MLNFIKKLFAKEEIKEEEIGLSQLGEWLDEKSKPIFNNLSIKISEITEKINNEKEKVSENLKILENAKLQNPKIPERVKTIMEGNRAAFIKKVSYFINDINFDFSEGGKSDGFRELEEKCRDVVNEINLLGNSTAKSYHVLNEFFAREAEAVAMSIKNIENCSKDIENSIKSSKIAAIEGIKEGIANIQNKIKLKEEYLKMLDSNKSSLQSRKDKKSGIEARAGKIKSAEGYAKYEELLAEKSRIESGINEIESTLFHDFSVLERALKKYAKVSFENEELIASYLSSPANALANDNALEIAKILGNLEKALKDGLEAEQKKNEKAAAKIMEIDKYYLSGLQAKYKNLKEKLSGVNASIKNNGAKNELEALNDELKGIDKDIEGINNKIANISNEIGKINIAQLNKNLQQEINEAFNEKIVIV